VEGNEASVPWGLAKASAIAGDPDFALDRSPALGDT